MCSFSDTKMVCKLSPPRHALSPLWEKKLEKKEKKDEENL